jgi:hypothetical protein
LHDTQGVAGSSPARPTEEALITANGIASQRRQLLKYPPTSDTYGWYDPSLVVPHPLEGSYNYAGLNTEASSSYAGGTFPDGDTGVATGGVGDASVYSPASNAVGFEWCSREETDDTGLDTIAELIAPDNVWPPEVDFVEQAGSNDFSLNTHYGTSSFEGFGPFDDDYDSCNLTCWNTFEVVWTSSSVTLYEDYILIATVYNGGGTQSGTNYYCGAGVDCIPDQSMGFDFAQVAYSPAIVGDQPTDIAWESDFTQ